MNETSAAERAPRREGRRWPRRLLWIDAALLVACLAGLVALRLHIEAVIARGNAHFSLDAHGLPWYRNFAADNARVERLERAFQVLLWGGVGPFDVALLALASWRARTRPRWPGILVLLLALTVGALLVLALVGATVPGGGLIG